MYYIQDKRQYVGNCILWYRINGAGYTCNIDDAEIFTEEESWEIINCSPEKYKRHEVEYVRHISKPHVDMQDLI